MDGRHAILPRAGLLMVLAWSVEQAILLDMQRRDSIVAPCSGPEPCTGHSVAMESVGYATTADRPPTGV